MQKIESFIFKRFYLFLFLLKYTNTVFRGKYTIPSLQSADTYAWDTKVSQIKYILYVF